MAYGLIYLVTNTVNGKRYVGQTTRTLEERWREHKAYKRTTVLWYAIRKYGPENFTIKPLACADDQRQLDVLEEQLIQEYGTLTKGAGYNRRGGGGHGACPESVRRKISQATRGRVPWNAGRKTGPNPAHSARMKGRVPWSKGRPASQAQREKQSAIMRGRDYARDGMGRFVGGVPSQN